MSIFEKMVEYFITLNKKMKRWQRAVSLLSAVVVFTTTYALILPAITLDKNTADEQPGIEVAASENNADESGTVYESASEEAPAEEAEPEVSEDNASEGGQQEDAEEAGQDEAEENAQAETDSADTTAPAENAEAAETTEDAATAGTTVEEIAAETGKSVDEIKLITEDTQLIYRGDDYVVYADFGESAKLPVGVQLDVREITKESDPEAYQAYYDKALSQMQDKYDENTQLSFARFYDITFKYEGMEVEPSGNVNVRIEYKQAVEEEKTENVDTVHFDKRNDEQAEVIDSNTKGSETSVEAVEFESDQFSVYGVVGSATIEKTVLASDGNNYNISVSYGPDAGVPEGAELKVEEIADRSKEYNEYLTQTEDTLGWEAGTATYARFFDITIVDENGGKVDIQAPVDVKIELADKEESSESNLQVVHFGKETEVVEASTEGSAVSFAANGFSVYAVVDNDDTGDYARMKLEFYNRDTKIAEMYVKNKDTREDLNTILYDPGVGTLAEGEMFKGWLIVEPDAEGNYDAEYTKDDIDKAKTIDEVRDWVFGRTLKELETVRVYAMIFKAYNIIYKDEDKATIHSEALIIKADDEKVDYTINQPYTPKEQDEAFMGWYTTDPVTAKDGSKQPFENGTEVEISSNVTFTVNAPKGHWLVFNGNEDDGSSASYTPPQFIPNGSTTKEPNKPTRKGYSFEGWYTKSGERFEFNKQIETDTELYAKWKADDSANYSVIIWRQRVTDDKNATDAQKTYDVAEVITLSGKPGSTINTVQQNGSNVNTGRGNSVRNYSVNGTPKAYTGFHAGRYDRNVTIAADGSSVLNVYYDRNLITIVFRPYTAGGTRYYILDENTGNLSNNNVTYTGLFDAPLDFTWPTFARRNYYEYDVLWHTGSNNGNLTLSFYGSYKHYIPSNVTDTMYLVDAGNIPYRFIKQKVDGTWPDDTSDPDHVLTIYMSGGSFNLSEKYAGFKVKDYRTSDYTTSSTGWTAARNADGSLKTVTNVNSQLNIRFERNMNPITYLDGTYFDGDGNIIKNATKAPLGKSKDIYYEASTASYNKGGNDYYVPPVPTGYVFGGWYTDPTCTVPYTFTTMPIDGITVYAKWIQKEYRVFLHPNVPTSDTSLKWGNQKMSFRVDYGDKIADGNQIIGTRDDYELIGWYTDPSFNNPFNFGAFELNDDTVTESYGQTEPTELDKYGNPTEQINKDANEKRFWIDRKLDLYAKWRAILTGANGINVEYDPGDGKNEPKDPLEYLDSAEATAGAASTPNDSDKKFMYWVVQKWNGSEYEDTNVRVNPGDKFEVLKANAKVEKLPEDPTKPGITHKYTVRLRAEYVPKEAPTNTHIWWHANNNNTTEKQIDKVNDGKELLMINEAVSIKPADTFTYAGRKFLGWAKADEGTDPNIISNFGPDDLFLTYHEENGGYYTAIIDNKPQIVKQVAADEKEPYQDLYAVWEKWGYLKIGKHFDVQEFYLDGTEMEQRWQTLKFTITNEAGDFIKLKKETEGPNKGNYILDEIVKKESISDTNPAPTVTLTEFTRETGTSDHEHQYFLYAWLPVGKYRVEEDHQQADNLLLGYTRTGGPKYYDEKPIANSCVYGQTKNIGTGEIRIDNTYRGENNFAYLKVEKAIEGNAPAELTSNKEFYFIVKNETLGAYISTEHDRREFTTNIKKAAVFSITPGGQVKYNGNVVDDGRVRVIGDNNYSVIELSDSSTPKAIKSPVIEDYDWSVSYSPANVKADKDTDQILKITNTYLSQFGSLKMTKIVDPEGDQPEGVTNHKFKITVKNSDGKWIDNKGAAVDTKYVFEVLPGDDNSIIVPRLAPGTYTVTEETEDPDPYPSYKLTVSASNGTDPAVEGSSTSVAVSKGKEAKSVFTNKYKQKTAKIQFIKVDEAATSGNYSEHTLAGAEFTLKPIGGDTKKLISGSDGILKNGSEGVFELKASEKESSVLTETKAPNGYNQMADTVNVKVNVTASGTTVQALSSSGSNFIVINPEKEEDPYIVLIPNNPGVELPHSGGSGTTLYTLGGLMLVIASALMYGFRMRRGERRFR